MTEDDKALVERLRGDWPEILVEKHWMMDSDAIDKQREEAADRIEQLEREKAVVSDLWEQQKEIALDYLADCNALSAENERLNINGIHSCHDQCARPLCVAWRENKRLRAVVDALLQHDASDFWGPDGEKNKRASYRGVIRKAKKARAELERLK